jgi:pimeloyl-ACP methyl ester carboxylesterase
VLPEVARDATGGRMQVRVDGPADGAPLVLLHGFSGSLHWFDPIVPLLADTFRVVRVDLLGHGATGGPAADAPVQAVAVAAVLEDLGISGATVAGHSFGADVAVELAESSPRVDRLVIIAQAPDYGDARLPRGRTLMTWPGVAPVLHRSAWLMGATLRGLLARDNALAARALHDLRALDTAMFRVVLVERRDRMARRPLDAQVRAAGKPTLAILGGRDHFYGDRAAPRYRAAGARVEVLPECGHSPILDDPATTAALIRAFASAATSGEQA